VQDASVPLTDRWLQEAVEAPPEPAPAP
jgi:hypothetical protein